jgi:hypothetical protein
MLDAIATPVLGVGDHSPEFQIAVAPGFMYDSMHTLRDLSFKEFANYSAQLVQYYNADGFNAPDGMHASPSPYRIKWWGIFNEPNINNLSPQQYTQLYNVTVPAMQAVDPTLKFAAVELSDWGLEPQRYLPPFVSGVTAQVDAIATHYYASCNVRDSDAQLFAAVDEFASHLEYIRAALQANAKLANLPIWVTENNVNADYPAANGMSNCNPGQAWSADARGSSAFFAAWRPYVFSRLAKAGATALYHWDFAADQQYGELDDQTGNPRLSYWVDFWLQRYFPTTAGTTPADMLALSTSDDGDLEVLAARNADNSIVVMISNRALASGAENNGTGAPRSVLLDISSLGTFTSGQVMTIDSSTDLTSGSVAQPFTPAPTVELTFRGYGVMFITLN